MGHFNDTKTSLKNAVKSAIPEGTVECNWFIDMKNMVRHLPYIYVRIMPINEWDVYTRDIGDATHDGSISDYHFQLHLFHSSCCEPDVNNDCTCEEHKYVQDIADRIKTYFLKYTPVGYDTDQFSTRETETIRGPRTTHICRVIIDGRVQVRRLDV